MGWDVSGSLASCPHPGSLQGTPFWEDGVLEVPSASGPGQPSPEDRQSREPNGPPSPAPLPVGLEAVALPIPGWGLLTASKPLSVWEAPSLCSPLWGGPALLLGPKLSFSGGESSSLSRGVPATASRLGSAQAASGPKRAWCLPHPPALAVRLVGHETPTLQQFAGAWGDTDGSQLLYAVGDGDRAGDGRGSETGSPGTSAPLSSLPLSFGLGPR